MPQPPTLKVVEIFFSFQGEGLRQGEPTIFVRFSGCNLRCSFCDTKYAWQEGESLNPAQILEKVLKLNGQLPARWICLTGGEPLLQDIRIPVQGLKAANFLVQAETNGTIYRRLPIDWYTVSPKPPGYFYRREYKTRAREVKLIAVKGLRLAVIQKIRADFPERTPVLLQPQSNTSWSRELAVRLCRQAVKAGIKNIRLTFQLHKLYHLR
jgi:organic radical activating enzyme